MSIDKMAKSGPIGILGNPREPSLSLGKDKNGEGTPPDFEALVAGKRDSGNAPRQDRPAGEAPLKGKTGGGPLFLHSSRDFPKTPQAIAEWESAAHSVAAEPSDAISPEEYLASPEKPAPQAFSAAGRKAPTPVEDVSRWRPQTEKLDEREDAHSSGPTRERFNSAALTQTKTDAGTSVAIEDPMAPPVSRDPTSAPDRGISLQAEDRRAVGSSDAENFGRAVSEIPSSMDRPDTGPDLIPARPDGDLSAPAATAAESYPVAASAATDAAQASRDFSQTAQSRGENIHAERPHLSARPELPVREPAASVSLVQNSPPRLAEGNRRTQVVEGARTAALPTAEPPGTAELGPAVFRSSQMEMAPTVLRPGRLELARELPIAKVSVVDAQTHFLGSFAGRGAAELPVGDGAEGRDRSSADKAQHLQNTKAGVAERDADLTVDAASDRIAVAGKNGPRSENAVGLAQQILPGIAAELKQISQESRQTAATPAAVAQGSPASPGGSAVRVLTIELAPRDLGTIKVEMTLRGDQLSVRIDTQSDEAAARLEEVKPGLSKALQSSGYSIEELTLHRSDAKFELTEVLRHGASDGPEGRSAQHSQGGLQHGGHENGQQPRRGNGAQNDTSAPAQPGHSSGGQPDETAGGMRDADGVRQLIV